jgi:SNF2 family DNA or RNA helicase
LEADQVFLYSGSPAPRGLNDIASYLGLFEHTDVAKDALRPHTVEGDIVWAPDTDPYSLRDDDPRCKFRYTRHCFLMHIVNADKLSDYEKGMRAKKVMPHFILRRDYQSQCPFESGNSIAKNLPDLTHLSLERTFTPSAKALYDRAADDWRNRLVLLDKDPVTGDVRRMPNPRAYRADALQVWYPYTVWLHVPNKHLVPADLREDVQAMAPVSGSTPQNDIDYYSWFSENSKHWASMPGIGVNLRQHRWILSRAVYLRRKIDPEAPVDVAPLPYQDQSKVSNTAVLREILKWSPKVGILLALLVKHVLLMDEKVIIWFTYPQTLSMFEETLRVLPYFKDKNRYGVLNAETSGRARKEMQANINNLNHSLRVVLASNKVAAVGLNFQEGCWTQFHADLSETLDNELQGIGRSYRLGQLMPVLIYSFMVAGSLDAVSIE